MDASGKKLWDCYEQYAKKGNLEERYIPRHE